MKKVIQKAEVKIIKPRIVKYICDNCGKTTGTKSNPKIEICSSDGFLHYCRKTCAVELKWRF